MPAQIALAETPPELTQSGTLLGIGDDDEVPVLAVTGRRRLLRQAQALLQYLALDRALQVQAAPHRPRGLQHLVGRQVEQHRPILRGGAQPYEADVRLDERLELDAHLRRGVFERSGQQSSVHGADDLGMLLGKIEEGTAVQANLVTRNLWRRIPARQAVARRLRLPPRVSPARAASASERRSGPTPARRSPTSLPHPAG